MKATLLYLAAMAPIVVFGQTGPEMTTVVETSTAHDASTPTENETVITETVTTGESTTVVLPTDGTEPPITPVPTTTDTSSSDTVSSIHVSPTVSNPCSNPDFLSKTYPNTPACNDADKGL